MHNDILSLLSSKKWYFSHSLNMDWHQYFLRTVECRMVQKFWLRPRGLHTLLSPFLEFYSKNTMYRNPVYTRQDDRPSTAKKSH